MRKFLVITCSLESPNGICVKSILEEAERRKIKVDCVCSANNVVNTEYITYYSTKRKLLDQFYYGDKTIDSPEYKISLWLLRISSLLMSPIWPFSAPLYYRKLKKLCLNLAHRNQYDVVIGTYNFYETLLVAYEIKRTYSDVKFIPYFLDCLSGGQGPRYLSEKIIKKLGLKRERKILPLADQIVIMKSHEKFYDELWKNESWKSRVKVLDIPLLCDSKGETKSFPKSSVKQILYTGALQVNLKNPATFLEIFSKCCVENMKLTFVGPSNCDDIIKEAQTKMNTIIEQCAPVSHDVAVNLMKQADFLLNIGSMNERQIPCKIFEYMSTGKPIISTAPSRDEPSIRYLKQYPAALILYEEDSIDENCMKLKQFLEYAVDVKINTSMLEKTFYICTPKAFVDSIEK